MARMNWDRVRKESQARRSGSEWVGSDGPGLGPTAESKPPSIRKASLGRSPLGRIPGCACKKPVGFVGQHRKFCPLRKNHVPDVHPRTDPDRALGGYPECIKKQLSAVSDFISSLQSQVNADHRAAESHQENIRRLIQVLQDELRDPSNANSDDDSSDDGGGWLK